MRPGDKLPNGATVIAEQAGVVFAFHPAGPTPYVTWRWDGLDPRSTSWGHYFSSVANAARDYEERVAQQGGDARAA